MIRKLIIVIAVLGLGATAVSAQSCQDTITTRQTLMKNSGAAAKLALSMIKGETPFDLAKAKEIFATIAKDAAEMPTLFPECSRTGDHTTAGPAIWEQPTDFKAMIAKFTADIKAATENTKDLDTFKASFPAIGKDCGSCHQKFRVRKS